MEKRKGNGNERESKKQIIIDRFDTRASLTPCHVQLTVMGEGREVGRRREGRGEEEGREVEKKEKGWRRKTRNEEGKGGNEEGQERKKEKKRCRKRKKEI